VRVRRALCVMAVVLAVLAAVAFVGSFPARQIIAQRRAIASAEERNVALDHEVAGLSARVATLQTPDEVKRLARQHLDLAEPGEESYRVLFPPADGVPLPQGWPFLVPSD
jgi:cell division protein FtsB